MRPVFDEITQITCAFCTQHLDAEYAWLYDKLAARLARKRPSLLLRGDRRIWAADIVYAIGRVNFLAGPAQQPPHPRPPQEAMTSAQGARPRH